MTPKDKNGNVIEVVQSWSIGWRGFYHLTGLTPFSFSGLVQFAVRNPRQFARLVKHSVSWRAKRQIRKVLR